MLVVGAWLSYQGQLTAGEFVSFVLFTNVLIKPVDKISALLEMYPKGMAGFRRFCDMLDEEPAIVDSKDAIAVERLQGDITFENVSFKYADSKPVLNNISFHIPAGKTVAFVGPSGQERRRLAHSFRAFTM